MPVNLITASYDHKVVFWDLGGTARRTLHFPESQVNCLALSSDKSKLAVAGHGCIRIYDASPNASPQQTAALGATDSSMLSGNVTSMFFIDIVAVKGPKPGANGGDGEEEAANKTNPKAGSSSKAIVNDYMLLVTSEDGSIKVFGVKTNVAGAVGGQQGGQAGASPVPQITFSLKHEVLTKVPITAATLFPNQQILLTGTQLGRLSVWHVPAIFGLPGALVTAGASSSSASVLTTEGGNVGTTGSEEGGAQTHSASSNAMGGTQSAGAAAGSSTKPGGATKPIQELALEADPTSVRSIAVSPVGNFISVATNIGRVHFFAFCRGASAMATAAHQVGRPLRPLRPIRNSNPFFNQSLNPFALEEFTFTVAHEKYVLKTAIAPNSRYIVTASADYSIGIFGVPAYLASGKFICFSDIYADAVTAPSENDKNSESESDPSALQFQGGVAYGVEDPRLRFPLRHTFLGHQRWVWDCCISPCSCYVLTSSSDHSARLWRVDGELSTASPLPMSAEQLAAEATSPTLVPPPTVVNSQIAAYVYHNKAVNCCLLDIEP